MTSHPKKSIVIGGIVFCILTAAAGITGIVLLANKPEKETQKQEMDRKLLGVFLSYALGFTTTTAVVLFLYISAFRDTKTPTLSSI